MENSFWILLSLFHLLTLGELQSIQSSHDMPNIGSDFNLTCIYPQKTTTTTPARKYIWFLNDQEIALEKVHFKQRGSKLLVKNFNPTLSGFYKCQILLDNGARMEISSKLITINNNNGNGSKNQNYIFSRHKRNKYIRDDLKFTPKPTNKNFELGGFSKIHCKARGTGEIKIHWMRAFNETLPTNVEDINGTLLFDSVALSNKGMYTCFASNGSETIYQSIEIGIMPQFETSPIENLDVLEAQQIVLDCVATGSPKPTIKWDYKGKILTGEFDDKRLHVLTNGSLVINEAQLEDTGTYACTIGNSAGLKRKESNVVVKTIDENEIGSNAVFVTCLLSVIYIFLVVALMFWCRQRKRNRHSEEMENKNEVDTTNDDLEEASNEKKPLNDTRSRDTSHQQNEKFSKNKNMALIIDSLMINYDKVLESTKLGCGQFGEVLTGNVMDFDLPNYKNKANDEDGIQAQNKYPVLIKSLSKNADETAFTEFRRQVDLFRKVNSNHVAKLLALSQHDHYHCMLLESSEDLKSYLSNDFEEKDLLKFCVQLADGLESISNLKLTHRDISLRNCIIVDSRVKLSMISLSKDTHSKDYYQLKNLMLPIRHIPHECIEGDIKYTTASDIYSCGIAIWEILTKGIVPFETMSNEEVYKKLNAKGIDHEMLLKQECISSEVKTILQKCWSSEAKERPSATELKASLSIHLT